MAEESIDARALPPPGVSIVIPNWNGARLLERNLPAVIQAARAHAGPCEIIVVDDGSSDASREVVRSREGVRLVEHERNRGFGSACLSGVKSARHELVFLLNSDACPDVDALAGLCRSFEDPETFAASPLILDSDGSVNAVTIRVPYLRRGRFQYRDHPLGAIGPGLPQRYTLFPLGGAFMVRRDRFLALGGFDELFHPFYYEDIDLGLRAWRRGWHCVVVAESRVTHVGGETIGRAFPKLRVRVIRKRNRILFHCKNLTGPGDPLPYLARQLLRSLVRLLRLDPSELLGTVAALPRLPTALARRRDERAAAVCSEPQILALIQHRSNAALSGAGSPAT